MERYVNKQLYLCELEETKRFLSPSEKLEKTQVFQAKWLNEMSPEEKAEYEMAPIVEKKSEKEKKIRPEAQKTAFHFYRKEINEKFKEKIKKKLISKTEVYRFAIYSFQELSEEDLAKYTNMKQSTIV